LDRFLVLEQTRLALGELPAQARALELRAEQRLAQRHVRLGLRLGAIAAAAADAPTLRGAARGGGRGGDVARDGELGLVGAAREVVSALGLRAREALGRALAQVALPRRRARRRLRAAAVALDGGLGTRRKLLEDRALGGASAGVGVGCAGLLCMCRANEALRLARVGARRR
jgi:hypothetical protein